jgi:regulator of protease activity HflC (stomatin/prohibitin superfamily)
MTKTHRNTGANGFDSLRDDGRTRTTAFHAEQAFTRDMVPVNVDALVFWQVRDAQRAALATTQDGQAIDCVAQTSLRETIGSSMLAALLCDRRPADRQLCEEIGRKAIESGVTVRCVEIRDVAVPPARQAEDDARSLLALRLCLARHRVRAAQARNAGNVVEAAGSQADPADAARIRWRGEVPWMRLKRMCGIWPATKGLI